MTRTSAKRQPQTAAQPAQKQARRAKPNRLAMAWLHERKRRQEALAKPGAQTRRLAAGVAVLSTILGLTAWFGGFVETGSQAGGRLLRASLTEAGFVVAHVEVRGARHAQAGEVAAALGVEPGSLIFDVDPALAKARVEALDWVGEAAVRRLLPNRIVVMVDERSPLALWGSPEGVVVLDAAGRAIEGADPITFSGLPRLNGAAAPEAAEELIEALGRHPTLVRRTAAFERVGGRRWDITLKSGLLIRLPEGDVSHALDQLVALEAREGVLELPLEVLDLRGGDLVMRPRDLPSVGFERGA